MLALLPLLSLTNALTCWDIFHHSCYYNYFATTNLNVFAGWYVCTCIIPALTLILLQRTALMKAFLGWCVLHYTGTNGTCMLNSVKCGSRSVNAYVNTLTIPLQSGDRQEFQSVRVNRNTLQSMSRAEVFIQKWPKPLRWRFFRTLLPEVSIQLCPNCNKVGRLLVVPHREGGRVFIPVFATVFISYVSHLRWGWVFCISKLESVRRLLSVVWNSF